GHRAHAEEERKVEWADHTDHAHRHPVETVLLAVDRRWHDLPVHAQRIRGRFLDDGLDQADFEEGFQAGAAELLDDQLGDRALVALDERDRLLEHRAPLERVDLGPLLLRGGGRAVGLVEVLLARELELADRLAAIRVAIDERATSGAVTPLAG